MGKFPKKMLKEAGAWLFFVLNLAGGGDVFGIEQAQWTWLQDQRGMINVRLPEKGSTSGEFSCEGALLNESNNSDSNPLLIKEVSLKSNKSGNVFLHISCGILMDGYNNRFTKIQEADIEYGKIEFQSEKQSLETLNLVQNNQDWINNKILRGAPVRIQDAEGKDVAVLRYHNESRTNLFMRLYDGIPYENLSCKPFGGQPCLTGYDEALIKGLNFEDYMENSSGYNLYIFFKDILANVNKVLEPFKCSN